MLDNIQSQFFNLYFNSFINELEFRAMRTQRYPMILVFVILLIIITVFAWKSCSAKSSLATGNQSTFTVLIETKY